MRDVITQPDPKLVANMAFASLDIANPFNKYA